MKEKVTLHKYQQLEHDAISFREPVNKLASDATLSKTVDYQLVHRKEDNDFVIKVDGKFHKLINQDGTIKTEEI